MTGHQLLLAVLVISSSLFNEYVTAWRACVVPNRNKSPGTNLNADSTALLDCNELDRNGIFKAMSEYDILLVKGEVSPKDLSPLTVEPLQKGMFLVKAPAQSPSVFKRNRRSVPHNSARHAELKDLDQNTFVVSTFAFNPKLLRNGTHAERYSVFAKLTEGVLQEHYKKYGAPDTAHWRDINNQIYTEDLFNNILAATGMFYDSESQSSPGVSKLMQGKTFGQIVNEFQSRMIEEDARGMPLSRKGPQLDLWPKKALHDESARTLLTNSSGVLLVNETYYLISNESILQSVLSNDLLFKTMQARFMLMPVITVEDGDADKGTSKFPGFRLFAHFSPRDYASQDDELFADTSLLGADALRKAALVLQYLNGLNESYPVTELGQTRRP